MDDRKVYHILNGDALKEQLPPLEGELIIARECLIDGEVSGDTLAAFWENRATFIAESFEVPRDDYYQQGVTEFEKIIHLPNGSEVNCWFEYDLFCQINFWFCCSLMNAEKKLKVYWVHPNEENDWKGFGSYDQEGLKKLYPKRKKLSPADVQLFSDCWKAYQNKAFTQLAKLAKTDRFPWLEQVVQAQIDRNPSEGLGRPEKTLLEIMEDLQTEAFAKIFPEFCRRAGIYGFGDAQVKLMLDRIKPI